MARSDAAILIDLEARTAQFDRQLKQSARQLNRLERQTKQTGRAMRTLARSVRTMGAALATGAIAKATRDAFRLGEAIRLTSERVGFTTRAYQELSYAAQTTGVNQATLDLALQRFTKRLGFAQQGVSEWVKTFAEMNVEIVDAEGNYRTSEAVFADFADAVANSDTQAQGLARTVKVLDSEGARMYGVIVGGSEALREFGNEAANAGVILSEQTIESLSRAQTAIDRFTLKVKVGFTEIVGGALIKFAQEMGEMEARTAQNLAKTADSLEFLGFTAKAAERRIRAQEVANSAIDWFTWANATNEAADGINRVAKATENAGRVARTSRGWSPFDPNGGILGFPLPSAPAQRSGGRGWGPLDPNGGVLEFPLPNADRTRAQFRSLEDEFKSSNEVMLQTTLSTTSRMADAFTQFALTGKLDMKEFARSVTADLLRIITLQALVRGAAGIGLGGLFPNADGNAFSGGRVVPFARGGVVTAPTLFPMSGGRTGLMGEAGAEGILPLRRTKTGRLGVSAEGAGGSVFAPQVSVVVNEPQGGKTEGEAFGKGAGQELNRELRGLFRAFLRDETRPGATLRPFG
jgi:hypothetical protein